MHEGGSPDRRSVRVLLLLPLLVVALVAGACGGSAAPPGTSGTGPAPVAASAVAPAGCRSSSASSSTTLNLTIDGVNRLVIVHVPGGYRGLTPVPLVLNLHGSGSTASQQEQLSGMDVASDQEGYIVAYPQALIPAGSGFDWNVPGVPLLGGAYPPANAASDVGFLTTIVSDLGARYCIRRNRIFATGLSGGGRMASQLACDSSTTFAAVAPVAGLRYPSPCPAARPVPVIAFHGTADPIDPYNGNGQAYWTYSVPVAAQRWAGHNGCRSAPSTTGASGYTVTAYGGCTGGASVELYSVTGMGHEWPGGPPLPAAVTRVLGPQSGAVDANATMWAFFAAHPLR
jgi:polyhydroxybutyrate depolymerase